MKLHELLTVTTSDFVVEVRKNGEYAEMFNYNNLQKCEEYKDSIVVNVGTFDDDTIFIETKVE